MLHTTAGKDYTAISHDLTFAPGADLTCYILDALDDSVSELSEDYFLHYVSRDPSVIINKDIRISIIIRDNTSMLLMEYTHNNCIIGLH